LNEYQWPDEDWPAEANKRPITAIKVDMQSDVRPQTNYSSKRRNIKSRGRANATGLSGTSQSSQLQDGINFNFILSIALKTCKTIDLNNRDSNEGFSKTQTNLIDKNFKDLILAESDPIESEYLELKEESNHSNQDNRKSQIVGTTKMTPIKEENASKQETANKFKRKAQNNDN
jgi:hypothetical protein